MEHPFQTTSFSVSSLSLAYSALLPAQEAVWELFRFGGSLVIIKISFEVGLLEASFLSVFSLGQSGQMTQEHLDFIFKVHTTKQFPPCWSST